MTFSWDCMLVFMLLIVIELTLFLKNGEVRAHVAQEKTFENKIKKFLEEEGAWFIKYWAGSQFTKSGIPDILACVNGYFVGIEVKGPNGKPSELQLHNIKKIRNANGFAMVLYPSAFDRFKRFIKDLKYENFNREMEVIWK